MATTTLWSKVKGWFSAPGAAPVATRGTVLRAPDAEGAPVPAPMRQKPEDPPPGEVAVASNRAVKSCTVYQPGQVIAGRYAVERVFEGGMGYVYITWDKTQNLRFAIKQPKAWLLDVPDFFARVVREADAWTGLGMHPHVAYCYFVRTIEDVPHIFVEYVDGGTLEDWIADGKCLDYRVGLELAIQCCHGMERAHGRGLLHRDLKPANILLTRDGQAKITDFGLVGEATAAERRQRTGAGAGETTYGTQMGTPEYMAPEQGRDPRRRSAKVPDGVWIDSDVYSFGVCLWEMVCGRRPFAHWSANTGQPPDPRDARRDLPDSLRVLLREVVARNRSQRPHDFAQLRERLNGIYRELYQQDAPSDRIELLDTAAAELTNQGYSYYELGKRDEALACFRQAVEKDPTHPQAVYNLGLLQWRACEIDDMEVLRRLESCGNNPQNAKETLAELTAQVHAERIDPDAAQTCLQAYPGRFESLFAGVEFKSPQCLRTLTGHTDWVKAVALTGDGRRALSGSTDKTLKLWDLETGQCLRTLTGHKAGVNAVALSGDGRRALSGGTSKTPLKLWDLATRKKCLRTLTGHTAEVTAVALSGDGRRALSGGRDHTLKLWDLETGECLHTLTGHTRSVNAVALTGDGRWALSGSEDKTLKLWDLAAAGAYAYRAALELAPHQGWAEHHQANTALKQALADIDAGLARGDFRAAYATLRTAWERIGLRPDAALQERYGQLFRHGRSAALQAAYAAQALTGHTAGVNAVALSGDGRRALSGSTDKTLKL
jgi:serine/threonine protein kinase